MRAIVNGTVHTVSERGTIDGGTVLIEEGEIAAVGPDGEVAESYAFAYDENGLQIERRDVYGGGETSVYRYAYDVDERGSWTRQVTTEDLGSGVETYEIRERVITYR